MLVRVQLNFDAIVGDVVARTGCGLLCLRRLLLLLALCGLLLLWRVLLFCALANN